MKKKKHYISIKTQLITILILFGVVPLLCVSIISNYVSRDALANTTEELTAQMLGQIGKNLNSFINNNQNNLEQFMISDFVQSGLLSKAESGQELERQNARQEIVNKLTYREALNEEYESVTLLMEDGTILRTSPTVPDEDLQQALELPGGDSPVWSYGLGGTQSLFLIKRNKVAVDTGTVNRSAQVVVIIQLKDSVFSSILDDAKLLDESCINLFSDKGEIVYQNIQEVIGMKMDQADSSVRSIIANKHLYSSLRLDNGFTLVTEIPEKSLTVQLEKGSLITRILIGTAVILAFLIGLIVAKRFTSPILRVQKMMKQAEEGDLTVHAEYKSRNELGQLMHSFNRMIQNIKKLVMDTGTVIEDTLEESAALNISTDELVTSFSGLSAAVEDMARGAVNQSGDIRTCSVSNASLSGSIEQVIVKADVIYENNQGARRLIEESGSSMGKLTESVQDSARIASDIKDSMLELSRLNENINGMVSILDGISEQTNLLSLNASIEAARAGAAGKGFAVVAEEVRNLSLQSKESTAGVRASLEQIERKTKRTAELILKSDRIFEEQRVIVMQAYDLFRQIVKALKRMDTELKDIKVRTDEMRGLKDEATLQMTNIAAVTEEFAAAADNVSHLSGNQKKHIDYLANLSVSLNERMEHLAGSIELFKVQ